MMVGIAMRCQWMSREDSDPGNTDRQARYRCRILSMQDECAVYLYLCAGAARLQQEMCVAWSNQSKWFDFGLQPYRK